MKSIFISHVYEDNEWLKKMQKWKKKGLLEGYVITHETEDKRQEGKNEIKKHLRDKINGCTILLILIGNNTHNHDWIKAEVELANSLHKKICCVRIPQTTGMKPQILNKYKELVFHPDQILKELKKL